MSYILPLFLFCLASYEGLCDVSHRRPDNVAIESVNLHTSLRWDPVRDTNTVFYTVQYRILGTSDWYDAGNCTATVHTQCDVSSVTRPYVDVTLRVKALTADWSSDWSQTEPFNAQKHSRFGAPAVRLITQSPNSLAVHLTPDPKLTEEYGEALKYRIYYREANGNTTHYVDETSPAVINPLTSGVKYCLRVIYVIYPERRLGDDGSEEQCVVIKRSEDNTLTQLAVGLSVCLVGVFIIGCIFVMNKNYENLKRILYPPLKVPTHIEEFLTDESPPCLVVVSSSPVETIDSMTLLSCHEEAS